MPPPKRKEDLPISIQRKSSIRAEILKKNFVDELTAGGGFNNLRQSYNKFKRLKKKIAKYDCNFTDDNICKAFLDLLNTIYLSSKEEEKLFGEFVKNQKKEMEAVAKGNSLSLGTVKKVFSGMYNMADDVKNAAFGERYVNDVYGPMSKFLKDIKERYKIIFADAMKNPKSPKDAEEKNKRIEKELKIFENFLYNECKTLQLGTSTYINYRMGKIDTLNKKYGLEPDFFLDEDLVFFRVLYSIAGVKCARETEYGTYDPGSDGITSSDNGLFYLLVKNTVVYVNKVLGPEPPDEKDSF